MTKFATRRYTLFSRILVFLSIVVAAGSIFLCPIGTPRAQADAHSTLSFDPSSLIETVGSNFTLDAKINPGANLVSGVALRITFDPAAMSLTSVTPSAAFGNVQAAAVINNTDGTISADFGVPMDETVTATSTVATFSFHALAPSVNAQVTYVSGTLVVADDDVGNNVLSDSTPASVTVTEAPSDSAPPGRSQGAPAESLSSGTTQTDISLTTDESATCKYSTEPGMAYGSMENTFTTTGGSSHSTTVSGLSDGSNYNYFIRCQDGSGNPNTDDYEISFSVATADSNDNSDQNSAVLISRPKLSGRNEDITIKSGSLLFSASKTLHFKGETSGIENGQVEIFKGDEEIGHASIGANGKWSLSVEINHANAHYFRFQYFDSSGNWVAISSKFRIRIDSEAPKITDLPMRLVKHPGDKIWWEAKDNDKVDYFRYTFKGKITKTTHSYFFLPNDIQRGTYFLRVKVFDRAGKCKSRRINIIII